MKIGFIGLGRMGKAMVLHLLEQGVEVVVYNRSREKTKELVREFDPLSSRGAKRRGDPVGILKIHGIASPASRDRNDNTFGKLIDTYSIEELVKQLEKPKIIWLMVPHGRPIDEMIEKLLCAGVEKGDIIIDGGNSFYKDSIRRYTILRQKGIHFLDIGTSGGLEGARNGACLMVGGDKEIFDKVKPILSKLAVNGGLAYFGSAGAGHFVKMVHNGVEYGMLQAIGEGFEILSKGMPVAKPFARAALARPIEIDLHKVAFNWMHGSVVRGWLMELLERALKSDPKLEKISGVIGGGSTGEWTLKTAKEVGAYTPVIKQSLKARKKSLENPTFSGKVVAALRREFGGHEVKKVKN